MYTNYKKIQTKCIGSKKNFLVNSSLPKSFSRSEYNYDWYYAYANTLVLISLNFNMLDILSTLWYIKTEKGCSVDETGL